MTRRSPGSDSIYQRCEVRLGCPPMEERIVDGKSKKVRPDHTCRGAWVTSIELPSYGTDRRRKVIVRMKKADLLRARRDARKALDSGGNLATAVPTVTEWCDQWMMRYGGGLKAGPSRAGHISKAEQYIKPSVGKIRLDKLTVTHVEAMHLFVTKEKGLSTSTALSAHRVLSTMLSDAVHAGLVPVNVAIKSKKPKVLKVTKSEAVDYLDGVQAREFLRLSAGEADLYPGEFPRWAVAILSGIRTGERLGITRDAIDFDRGVIRLVWQLQRIDHEHGCGAKTGDTWPCGRRKAGYCPKRHVDIPDHQEARHVSGGLWLIRPKTQQSWREIPMVGLLRDILKRWVDENKPGMEGLIFTRPDGRPIDLKDDNLEWDAALRRSGMPDVDRHSARHTCNTVLTELGITADVRRLILGHASEAVNEQVYTHTSQARVQEALEGLSRAIDWR